jgi:heat shock protein HtpX
MFQAYGLYGHIAANRTRSVFLLAAFVALLHALLFSFLIILEALSGGSTEEIISAAAAGFAGAWPVAAAAAALWFVIAWFSHQALIRMATGAKVVTRAEASKLYNALENLCISRGITMPRLQIIETPARNAYASGLREGQYVIAVTRGLIDALEPPELEAVLAHELTHIRNKDAQLMVIAVIFAGVFAFFGDIIIGRWDFPYGWSPTRKPYGDSGLDSSGSSGSSSGSGGRISWPSSSGGSSDSRSGKRGRDGDGIGGALLAIAIAIAIILISWGISTLIRLALSRSREYLADAGSVELTKNPDAMISALRKIEGRAVYNVPSRMESFFIENPVSSGVFGLFSTHPAIEDRIAALTKFAGGVDRHPVEGGESTAGLAR